MRINMLGRTGWVVGLGIVGISAASAQPCDVDDYITKAIGIEEPWLENAAYLFAQVDNNGSPQSITLAPEIEARFSDRVGMELDLPTFTAVEPLGSGPSAFGPVAAGIKVAALHSCDMSNGRATLLTGEVEGQYWANPRPAVLPGQGNSVTAQVMWAQLWYPWFTEGEAGYTQRVGSGVTSGWFVNTSLGRALNIAFAVQLEVEADNQLVLDNGRRGIEGSVLPQVGYHLSQQWLLAVGEQAAFQQDTAQPQWSTWMMVERDFA
ncbi:hypothetical protein [Acidithiobacillus sulfuriphilus]|uniref:Transporter n=2 Tax=Acidithiobacillus sulfuriphilus TaxID=1867749 RepID=A0A3M8QT93_9PROT|nr:hypothetical protein [Acidithiobacillus sulfuriphilus]RNF57760.1 hypothetical protein EC580_14110 [Acidithiobacillus sulfuriphilus]